MFYPSVIGNSQAYAQVHRARVAGHRPEDTFPPRRNWLLRFRLLEFAREKLANTLEVQAGFSSIKTEVTASRKSEGLHWERSGEGVGGRFRVGMAAQIPIVATTATPGIVRNSKKRPVSPSHNGSSAGAYSTSKKKKASASSFAQVCCSSTNLRVRGGRAESGRERMRGAERRRASRSEGACARQGASGHRQWGL